jgi:hypothetical protein
MKTKNLNVSFACMKMRLLRCFVYLGNQEKKSVVPKQSFELPKTFSKRRSERSKRHVDRLGAYIDMENVSSLFSYLPDDDVELAVAQSEKAAASHDTVDDFSTAGASSSDDDIPFHVKNRENQTQRLRKLRKNEEQNNASEENSNSGSTQSTQPKANLDDFETNHEAARLFVVTYNVFISKWNSRYVSAWFRWIRVDCCASIAKLMGVIGKRCWTSAGNNSKRSGFHTLPIQRHFLTKTEQGL